MNEVYKTTRLLEFLNILTPLINTVESLNNGHFGTNINSSCLSPV